MKTIDGAFEKSVTWTPSYDKTNPDPLKSYGIGSVTMRFLLKGPLGATQFTLLTGWYLKHIRGRHRCDDHHCGNSAMASDLGYHSPKPTYEGQRSMECDVIPGGSCYYDGSTLSASELFDEFCERGEDAIWERLMDNYRLLFEVQP
jgi:hypothetical protein